MRKLLAFLLIITLLISTVILASCEKDIETGKSSNGEDSLSSEEQSGESSEEDGSARTYRTLVSVGKPYTVSFQADKDYPDLFSSQLTDGILACDEGVSHLDGKLAGWTTDLVLNIDLGDDGKRLYEFNIRLLAMNIYGIGLPSRVSIYYSNDGSKYEYLARAEIEEYVDRTMRNAVLVLDEPIDARYIRFRVNNSAGFLFTDEALVYADVPSREVLKNNTAEEYKNDNNDYTAIKKLTTGVATVKTYSKNVAAGMKYTINATEIDERATDVPENEPNKKLTSGGTLPNRFEHKVWVGLSAKDNPNIVLDLGKVYDNLYSFKVYALGEGTGVRYPDYIDFYASQNGKDYYIIGRVYAPENVPNFAYTINLAKFIKARYVKFAFPSGVDYYWVEELEVYAGSSNSFSKGNIYPPLNLPKVDTPVYWDSTEPDYTTPQNLILGRPQQISASIYIDADLTDDTPQTSPLLTNGQYAKSNYCYSGEWFEIANKGGSRDFFYDLEKTSTVTGFKINILVQKSYGIEYPEFIRVYLSDDGTNWYGVYYGKYDRMGLEGVPVMLDVTLDTPYAARFVRIMIKTRGFGFIDEMEIWGTKAVEKDTISITQSGIKPVKFYTRPDDEEYASNKNTNVKASDVALVFGDKGNDKTLLPYVAYLDKSGNIVDTFMNGFLYTPSGSGLPSGHSTVGDTDKADWLYFYDVTFNGVNGLDRLEEVVAEVKKSLKLDDNYKVYVYISLLNVSEKVKNFGDVDGDGVSEDLTTAEGRKKAVMWFMKLCDDTFKEREYKNIALDGFYWLHETAGWEVDYSPVMTEVGNYVHEFGQNYLWIPYYNAEKFYFCNDMGFDITSIQPNYAFTITAGVDRFISTIKNSLKYGMCVELEVAYQSYGDMYYVSRYLEYLYYGAVYGYMKDATHFYYDDDNFFARMAYAEGFIPRLQYDYTYQFAKGVLKANPDKRADISFNVQKDTILKDKLAEFDRMARYKIETSPHNGTVTINLDGTFTYYPNKGFTGTDTFTYTYNNYLGDSPECVVKITVG